MSLSAPIRSRPSLSANTTNDMPETVLDTFAHFSPFYVYLMFLYLDGGSNICFYLNPYSRASKPAGKDDSGITHGIACRSCHGDVLCGWGKGYVDSTRRHAPQMACSTVKVEHVARDAVGINGVLDQNNYDGMSL